MSTSQQQPRKRYKMRAQKNIRTRQLPSLPPEVDFEDSESESEVEKTRLAVLKKRQFIPCRFPCQASITQLGIAKEVYEHLRTLNWEYMARRRAQHLKI